MPAESLMQIDYEQEHEHNMKTARLLDGSRVPVLGQGTWTMGEKNSAHASEVAALRLGIDLGMTLIDTAEMYGDGAAEKVVGDAINGQRDRVFIVTKAYPHNASRTELPKACERSLRRLRIETIDLYLLHWREKTPPLEETVEAFVKLRSAGKIKRWGVSNFDVDDMEQLWSFRNGSNCATNQVLYNLENREIEFDLLPFLTSNIKPQPSERGERDRRQNREGSGERARAASEFQTSYIPVMAYSPLGHGRGLLENATLKKIARRHDRTTAQIALTWVLRQPHVIAIPKASDKRHIRDNARSTDIELTKEDLAEIDQAFPPPKSKQDLPTL